LRPQEGGGSTCDVQTNAFDSLIAYFRSHAKQLHLQDWSKIQSVDELIKSEFMYAINRRWEAKEDSCNLNLSRLLVRTYPEYVPGLNVIATIHALFQSDSAWVYFARPEDRRQGCDRGQQLPRSTDQHQEMQRGPGQVQ
jgi:hypothetical protein